MITEHTRTHRLFANVAFIAILAAFGYLIADASMLFKLAAMTLLLVPAYLMYAYYIASICCGACGASLIAGKRAIKVLRLYALFAPVHIPCRCADCGAKTDW
jgi:hypothetical protein